MTAAEKRRVLELLAHTWGVLHGLTPNVPAAMSILGQAGKEIEEWEVSDDDSAVQ